MRQKQLFFSGIRIWALAAAAAAGAMAQQAANPPQKTASDSKPLAPDEGSVARLAHEQVSGLPLNKRDFSQLLLLASGTQTDTNGAANFTQQFTVNGQRGSATVFAMDGIDTTDPEMGGATFSNFNVDAIQEIKALSGVMAAEFGHGAAGFTNVLTRSGTPQLHGSVFEFLRNAALDARNFFDRRSIAQPGRIPPFVRNEFGFTNGGPLMLPGLHHGKDRTFYFGQYQGFRQVLGTTQVLPVPTAEERRGINITAFPGDVLFVPVNPKVAPILAAYPMPSDAQGPYGARTYAISSKVRTVSDQFSVRIDHRLSNKGHLFGRFNFNNIDGPLTNPSQTALDPAFATRFYDNQRNAGITCTHSFSPRFLSESSAGYIRSTPKFLANTSRQPGMRFADGAYEAFNAPAGSVSGGFTNLFQLRQNFSSVRGNHNWKAGFEIRYQRDTVFFGQNTNGAYTFGGGPAYSPVHIRSLSGLHDIHAGDPLPDALSGFLTATPFSYSIVAAPELFGQGDRMGVSGATRRSFNFFVQDSWKISPRLSLNYGLRYEVNSRIGEVKLRTSGAVFEDQNGRRVTAETEGAKVRFLVNPQPPYQMDWGGWGPRLAADWRWKNSALLRVAGSVTTLLPNIWQTNFITGGMPYAVSIYATAAPGLPLPFENTPIPVHLPAIYRTGGELMYPNGRSADAPANSEMDVLRFQRDLAANSFDRRVRAVSGYGMAHDFRNGYVATFTAGMEQNVKDVKLSAAYVSTIGVKLVRLDYPNGYVGASREHAPYTLFDSAGNVQGGFSQIYIATNRSHSSYHSLQASAQKTSLRAGLGFQASYTLSKSLDDTSAVLGGFVSGSSGTMLQTSPQNPRDLKKEKGPSTFDVTHVFALSAIQELPLDRVKWLDRASRRLARGWQLIGMTSLASGSPFTIYSGIQQTGVGSNGADRPDQTGRPELSTSRTVREDYFGRGEANASYFSIPKGRHGYLGRNTFRGPGYANLDISVIKNTPIGTGRVPERVVLQTRFEFFNVLNVVNFGLPANIVLGPGFGLISRTAGTSRQIQISLKILF